jgi:malic enzyme
MSNVGEFERTHSEDIEEALESRRGGVIETSVRVALETLADLRRIYTPGVAVACRHIAESPKRADEYTHIGNKVAIVTNGTAILGLGDIGPLAGLPVMEGKAAIFRRFADISAEPVLIDAKDPATIVEVVERIHLGYGAIQLPNAERRIIRAEQGRAVRSAPAHVWKWSGVCVGRDPGRAKVGNRRKLNGRWASPK